jgi:LacI family transcriptional regulator
MLAIELPMARPPQIAVLVPNFLGVTRAVLGGIGQYTREHNPWIIVNNPWEVVERGLEPPRQPIDGAILCFPDILRNRRIPTVLLTERFVDAPMPRVIADSAAIGRLAAEHLLDCGLRHLAFIGYADAPFAQRRGSGFVQAAQQAGLTCHVFGAHNVDRQFPGAAVRRWLSALPKPVGLMTCNDHMGMLMLGLCRELGLRVPADVAIVGVDNDELVCDYCTPPLSSVRLDSRNAGYKAAQMLHGLLRGQKAPARPIVIQPLGVVRRQSSDIVAIGGEVVGHAIKFMRDHACDGLSVADVVRQTPLARRTLEKACRALLGHSPFNEIRRIQLARARELLRTTLLPIGTIAQQVGLGEGKRLSEVFRSHAGQTPSEYRRAQQTVTPR